MQRERSPGGEVHICFARYLDHAQWWHGLAMEHYAWEEGYFTKYTQMSDDTWLLQYEEGNLENTFIELEAFARQSIGPFGLVSKLGTPGREVETMDWPMFYGWTVPEDRNRTPIAFVSQPLDPVFLTMDCTVTGQISSDADSLSVERFLRARRTVQGFARLAAQHLTSEHLLEGPDIEDWIMAREYEFNEPSPEDRRRRRLSSTLGAPKAPQPGPVDTWSNRGDLVTDDEVMSVDIDPDYLRRIGKTPATPYSSDEQFKSALGSLFQRRRSKRA